MASNLVVVESPAKARTIKKYLGRDYEVLASYGHVRDLRPKEGAVEPENDFQMHYEPVEKNVRHVTALSRAMKKADALYLATDPDREGEAIAWHVVELLKERNALDSKPVHRVVFHEITQRAITDAVSKTRRISMDLVYAQQARRALDYLVGFNLSPLLWKKIRRGLSAGRVQSPALRMIVEREIEIENFVKREYWTLEADLLAEGIAFTARLSQLEGQKLRQFSVTTEARAREIESMLRERAGGELRVAAITRKQRKRNPAAPFTTSTMQQDASRKLGFSASRTMRVAQRLYEGVETGAGSVGLITYMRTDSVVLAREAVDELRDYIAEAFGVDKMPARPRMYKTKSKNAQEAHEAIRPTSVQLTPASLRAHLGQEEHRLYELIWKRTVACQMRSATIDTVAVDLQCCDDELTSGSVLRANGSSIADPGYLSVYQDGGDGAEGTAGPTGADGQRHLPSLKEGQRVALNAIRPEQHFTEPPPRYGEASLIKTLEEYGIGRPSTYASIISTLLNREYAELEARRFLPTDVGRLVNAFLTEHFGDYVDYEFTARLEDDLDAISRGEKKWVPLMHQFWDSFDQQVREKEATVSRRDATQVRELGVDPKSGRPVSVRMGRFGPYAAIGTPDDEEKPRFAGLHADQRMNAVTLKEALALFKLPRQLGETARGEPVSVSIGRYGPYVRFGPKYASLASDDDPYTIDLERALVVIAEKEKADAQREIKVFDESDLRVLNGPYGPYITDGKRNARVPKDREPDSLTLAECEQLIAAAPTGRRRKRRARK